MNVHKQIEDNKTNNGAKKNENEQAQIDVASWLQSKNNKHETSQKKTVKTQQQGKAN